MAKKNLAALKKIKATKGAKTTEQFALDLLRKTAGFGNAEQLDKAKVIPSNDTVSKYLPNRVFFWGQDKNRNYQTLLIELDKTAKELFDIPAFKQKNELLDVLEDILARISQLTLNGFARERSRDASTKWGKQIETLVVLAVKDDKSDEKNTQHVVSFATVNQPKGYEESLDIFYVREFSEISDPTAIAKQNSLLKKRHFDLLNSAKWKDAFVTVKERNSARKLLEDCKKAKPNNDDIVNSCVDLLQNMTSGYLRGQHNQKLKRIKLHSGHEIGRESNGSKISPLQGEAIRDQKDRLLGYLVYCVNSDTSADDIREFMENHNHFHNVLIIYPDTKNPTIELWQGKKRLEGKLRKDKSHFTGESKLVSVLTRFFAISSSNITNPERLAKELAFRARILKQVAIEQLDEESKDEQSDDMEKLYRDFKAALIHTITKNEFADAYAQTLTYGLLSARWVMAEEVAEKIAKGDKSVDDLHFSRRNAISYLPTSSGFLKQFFEDVLKNTADDGKVAWILGDIADLLDKVHIQYVFGEGDSGDPNLDPIIHFYEPFLDAYDKEERQRRGVYYTPQPVVNFIVRNVDQELKNSFGLKDGLADISTWQQVIENNPQIKRPSGVGEKDLFIKLLDPATGTGTFLVAVIDIIYKNLDKKWTDQNKNDLERKKLWNKYVDNYLLKKLYGFEVMMASYAIAHLKVSLKLRQTGYTANRKATFNILLTNTLEGVVQQSNMRTAAIAKEAERAVDIKRKSSFTVIVGNPPYKGESANKTTHLDNLLSEYKKEPEGGHLKERNPKWINDDYVKFIRYAQYEISKSGCGIHSFISAHSWMDNPTFRGMRSSIMKEYNYISVLDLHGNINRSEVSPDGSKDENVFNDGKSGIRQGVAIFLFTKLANSSPLDWKRKEVCVSDVWGKTEHKFNLLNNQFINNFNCDCFIPRMNLLIFNSTNEDIADEYEKGWKINDIFPINSVGIVTGRDKFVIDLDKNTLIKRFTEFSDKFKSDDEVRLDFFGVDKEGKKYRAGDSGSWNMQQVRKKFRTDKNYLDKVQNILYRPFDMRWIMYHREVIERGRWEVMDHMTNIENIALVTARSNKSSIMDHFYISNTLVEIKCGESTTNSAIFPLYLKNIEGLDFDDFGRDDAGRSLNLNSKFIEDFENSTSLKLNINKVGKGDNNFSPLELLFFIYATFYSTLFRTRYADYLRVDFPRIKIPSDKTYFFTMVNYGKELSRLHTLTFTTDEYFKTQYELNYLTGSVIQFIKYKKINNSVVIRISKDLSFPPIPKQIIEFKIGGHKVVDKYLKARIDYVLSDDLLNEVNMIFTSIKRTIDIVDDIDREYK